MANITVDILAKVVGYELSIKALLAALAKIDPGSELGKSVTKAMEQALSLVKALSKNMFPKASSDTLINSIIEKTNRAGEAILNVAALLQGVLVGDLNLGAFGGDIENFRNLISSLETELNTKLNQGILNTVNSSDLLKSIFLLLGTDLTKADASTLFKDLQRGASEAAKEVATAEAALKKIQDKQRNNEFASNQLQGSLLYTEEGRKSLDVELNNIMNSYGNNFTAIRDKMAESMSKLNLADGGLKLLDSFFRDLTPDNIRDRINNLYKELLGNFDTKGEFYKAIFGEGTTDIKNSSQVAKMFDFNLDTEQIRSLFRAFLDRIQNEIKPDQAIEIKRLIDKGQLELAAEMTEKDLDAAYGRVQTKKKKLIEETAMNTLQEAAALLQLATALANKGNIDAANTLLMQQIEQLRLLNESLLLQINSLRELLGLKLGAAVGDIRNTGATENRNMGQGFEKSLEMSLAYKEQLALVAAREQALGKLLGVVLRWFSIYAAIRMVRQAINSVISTVKELDATITEIAIVTSMDLSELWDLMPQYTQLARDYAASISGVYKVSQLYYQQGLLTADVMALTELTLKMARISGLDYAQATDYMTNAVRSFKMEMTEALTVVDVYSAIAASSATSVTELASAMSKTASSAQAVGSSFENTTAMMAVMIEATRESAENIGSAMKSIISRYGEMTSDPSKAVDSEGQEMSLNRVDKALLTVGISIHNAEGEFRNFDDVIMELAEKWNTIDTNTLRYIATIMAGNRQQSRFLALVSSYDRLKELSAKAADSEDASLLLFLKTLDSVEAKTQLFLTSVLALYVNSGIEDLYKGLLDWANLVITSLDLLSDKFGTFAAVGKIGATFTTLATLVTNIFNTIKMSYSNTRAKIAAEGKIAAANEILNELQVANETAVINEQKVINNQLTQRKMTLDELTEIQKRKAAEELHLKEINALNASKTKMRTTGGMVASFAGLAATTAAASVDVNENRGLKSGLTAAGGILSGVGTGLMIGGWAGAIIGALTALPSILEAIGIASESTTERLSRLLKAITDTSNAKLEARSQLKTLTDYKAKFDELSAALFESAEAKEEFVKLQNDIAASYPELISGMDAEGNYIVNMTDAYKELAAAKASAYKDSFVSNLGAELAGLNDLSYVMKNTYGREPLKESGINIWKSAAGFVSSGGKSDLQDYIIDMALGLEHDLKVETLRDLMVDDKAELFIIEDAIQNWGYSGNMLPAATIIEKLNPADVEMFGKVMQSFVRLAKGDEALTFQLALQRLIAESTDEREKAFIGNIQEPIGNYLFSASRAADFQDLLITSKINSSNAEYMKILLTEAEALGDSRFIANDLLQYGIQQKLNTDLKAYLDANRKRIGTKYKDANNKEQVVDEKRLIEEFYTGLNGQSAKDLTYYNELLLLLMSDGINNQANEIYKNLGKYSKNYIKNSGLTEEALNLLFIALDEQYKNIFTDYTNWVENAKFSDNKIKDSLIKYSDLFSAETLLAILKQYSGILNNDFLSEALRNTLLSNLTSIYDEIAKISDSDYTAGQTLLATVLNADLTSLLEINSTIEAINELDLGPLGDTLLGLLTGIKDNLTANLTTEFTQLGEKLAGNMSDFEKAISNSTKGMDLKTATEMAGKMGKGLGDFQFLNGKFYYDNYEDIEKAYLDADQQLIKDLETRKNATIDATKNLLIPNGEMIIETESFNMDELDAQYGIDEEYLKRWESEFAKIGLTVSDVMDYALGNSSIVMEEDLAKIEKMELTLSTSPKALLPIDQIIKEYSDIKDIYAAIDNVNFDGMEGITANSLKSYISLYMNRSQEDIGLSFSKWLEKYLDSLYETNVEKINQYATYSKASSYLLAGDIENFLITTGSTITDALKSQILSGDITNLPTELLLYASLIYDTYHSVNESIANSMISAIGDGSSLIKVTETNKGALDKIQKEHSNWLSGETTVGSYITIAAENLLTNALEFENFIISSFDTGAERIKALTEAHKNAYSNNLVETYGKIAESDSFAYEDLLTYIDNTLGLASLDSFDTSIELKMSDWGLAFDSMGNVIIDNYELWILELESTVNALDGSATAEEVNHAKALLALTKARLELNIASAFDDVLKNYSNISIEAIEALANSLGMSFDEVLTYLTPNGDGSYRLDMTKTKDLIAKANGKVSEATLYAINLSVGSIADEYSKSLEDARSYMKNGTTSREDMEKFVLQYNLLTGESINADQAFTYNSTKKKWTLSGDYVIKYAQKRAELLLLVDDEYNLYINDLLRDDVGESIISAIDAIGTQLFEDSLKDLLASLTTYYTNKYQSEMSTEAIPNDKTVQEASAQVMDAILDGAGLYLDNMLGQKSGSIADQIGRKLTIAGAGLMSSFGGFYTTPKAGSFLTALGTLASTAVSSVSTAMSPALSAAQALTTILAGGSPAVLLYKTINPHATLEELEKIFYSRMNILNSAISDVDLLVAGLFVGTEGKLYEILKQAGAIDADADGVVAAGFSMVNVYTQIYAEMYKTLGHTNADLNNIYAKLLTEEDKLQITLKDALSNAGGMSYEAFAQLMNTYNLDMRKVMDNLALAGNLVRDGFGNIVITNFKAFSDYMKDNGANWDFTSSEIKAAYNSYVDAKAELLNQDAKDMQSLADLISGLTEAKPKTAINVSYIEDALGTDALNEIATRFNAALHDGILTITDYTDIPGLINEIARLAEKEKKLLPELLAELADAVHSLLSDITSLITNGISGNLNNADALKLLSWYRKYTGKQEALLLFTNTAEGLKLSNRSARELYTVMRQVDALLADIVFDELKESLIESEDHFKTILSTAAYIDALRKGTAYPDNSERIADLNEELALAEKINAERSTTEDDSFKFMEGKIPAGQNNPLNYWQNWAEAFKTIKASMKGNKKSKNTMAYEDFYNIVTEMGNLTKLTGLAVLYGDVLVDDSANAAEKSVTAAELIESAAGALKNVDGKLVVDLSKIGVDLNMSSLKGLGKELDSLVDAVADSQIEMLESIAKLLEVIVAMENLKDIDVDFDGEIDLSELFSDWEIKGADATQFTANALEAAKKILSQADAMGEDSPLYEALNAVRINGYTIRQILEDATDGIRNLDLNAEQYQAAINALYLAMMSNDYDLDNIGESLFNILSEAGLDSVAIDVGEKTYYLTGNTRYIVDWNDKDSIDAATEALQAANAWTDSKDVKSNIQDAINKLNDEDIELTQEQKVNLEYAIAIATGSVSIKLNKDKNTKEKGAFVGNYKGLTFYSDDKESLENVVKKALGLEEEGFTVKIDEKANIDATYKLGKTNIKYDPTSGKYTVEGEYGDSYDSLQEAIKDLISKGFANLSDIGTYNIGETSFEVAYSAQLLAAYSIEHNADGDKYHYNGLQFSSYNDLIAYISATNLTKNENKWNKTGGKDTKEKKETFTYKNNTLIKIEIDYSGAEPKVTYKYGDKTVTDDPKNIAKLLEISDLVDASKEKGGLMNLNESEMTATFVYDGMLINVEANVESGTFIYKFHDPQTGTNIEASSLSALKSAVAAILGKKSSLSGDDSGTITVNNVTFNYKMNAEGHIEVELANKDLLTEETQKQAALLAEQLNLDKGSTSETKGPVNITATSVNVTLADGASVTLDGELTDDLKTIKDLPPMKGEVSELELTMANNATIALDTQGKDLKLTDAVKAEGDIEELTLNINSEGEASTVKLAEPPAILSDAVDAEGTVNTLTLSTTGESTILMSRSSVEIRPKPIPEATGEVTNLEITNSANTEVTGYAEPKPIPSMSAKVTTLQLSADNVELNYTDEEGNLQKIDTALIIHPEGLIEDIPDFETILTIITQGGVSDIADFTTTLTIITKGGGGGGGKDTFISDRATGNVGLAKAKGTQTLMGELGPELVVSNGRYFVAGLNGAEMVNLADDAIVFNHLQTELLLKNGMSNGRGRAVTNEHNAVAFATGNINGGPAMASASAALAAIRLLINMWKSLKDANVSDLAGAGGGGGGGGGEKAKIVDPKAWVDTVERWYNLTQEIARLEEEITHLETIRTKLLSDWLKNGNAYYRSLKKSLDALNQQIAAQELLNISRREYFNKRVEALKEEALGLIYTFDEEGQLLFRKDVTINGKQGGMEFLTDLYGFDNLGKANYTNKEKYEILMASGFADYMKYDSNGMEIKVGGEGTEEDYETFYEQATQAFRDRLNLYNEATLSLLDEINKGEDDIEKLETDRNELMKEIRDNQMELENEILDAIVESRQRQIDALQDQRDALEETTGKYIEGLSNALEKERDMYERQESLDELNRNKRRLAILQRSGGSAADISSLQSDISSQERDLYFDAQLAQIDAIQEASDLEIERLDKLIELMTETLEFLLEYGLLWGEVYEVMDRSSLEIVDFINGNSAEFWKMSTLAQVLAMNDETFKAEYWTSYKDDLDVMATEIREALLARDYAIFDERMKAEYGDNYDANGRYRQAFENEYRQGWNIDEATEVARKLYHDEVIKPLEEARRAAERAAAEAAAQVAVELAASGSGGGGGSSSSSSSSKVCRSCSNGCKVNCGGSYSNTQGKASATCSGNCTNSCTGGPNSRTGGYIYNPPKKSAAGGYVGHGIYELGEQGIETVLTASQTQVLRNNILSNRPNSLISLLKTYNEGFNQNKLAQATAVLQKEDENPSIFIENASVNMNVQQISNDYDARRAGEQALNEIMRIARKSGATNSVRR